MNTQFHVWFYSLLHVFPLILKPVSSLELNHMKLILKLGTILKEVLSKTFFLGILDVSDIPKVCQSRELGEEWFSPPNLS